MKKQLEGSEEAISHRRGGFCYIGDDVMRDPDLLYRILGMTISGRRVVDYFGAAKPGKFNISILDGGDAGFEVSSISKSFRFGTDGGLQSYKWTGPSLDSSGVRKLLESIVVEEYCNVGGIALPKIVKREAEARGIKVEAIYTLREDLSKLLSKEEFQGGSDPLLSPGVIVVDQKTNVEMTVESAERAFNVVPHSGVQRSSEERLEEILQEREKLRSQ